MEKTFEFSPFFLILFDVKVILHFDKLFFLVKLSFVYSFTKNYFYPMKKSILLIVLLLVIIYNQSYSQDTLWTRRYTIPGSIKNAIFSPNDSKILVTGTETFFEVNPENGEMIRELPEFKTGIIAVNPKTNIGINYLCQLVDLNTYKVVKNIIDTSKYKISMYNFTFNSDLSKVAFLNNTYEIGKFEYHQNFVIIDLETGKETIIEKEFGDNEGSGATIAMSPNGKYLATITSYFGQNQDPTDDYRLLSLFDLETNKKVNKLEFPYSQIEWTMKFSPDGSMLAVSKDGIDIFAVPSLELIDNFQFIPKTGGIFDYKFSQDNLSLFLCGPIRPIQEINIKNKTVVNEYLFRYSTGFLSFPNNSFNKFIAGSTGGLMLYPYLNTSVPHSEFINTIYPNPTTGQLILDNIGKTLFTNDYQQTNDDVSINVFNFPKGVYYVNIENNNKVLQTLKFIKE